MSRDFQINGPSMVYVKGRADTGIASLTELGLSDAPIRVRPQFKHSAMNVNAWGAAPVDNQFMLATVDLVISLIHFDRAVLDVCLQEAMGGAPAIGQLTVAGTRLGNNKPRFFPGVGSTGNHYIGLNISSPVMGKPWRFFYAFMNGMPMEYPLGVEKSIVTTNWTVVPFTTDPYQAGISAYGFPLWDHGSDL